MTTHTYAAGVNPLKVLFDSFKLPVGDSYTFQGELTEGPLVYTREAEGVMVIDTNGDPMVISQDDYVVRLSWAFELYERFGIQPTQEEMGFTDEDSLELLTWILEEGVGSGE